MNTSAPHALTLSIFIIERLLIEIVIKGWSISCCMGLTIFYVPWVNSPPKLVFREFCISHSEVGVSSLTMWLTVAAFKVHYSNYN